MGSIAQHARLSWQRASTTAEDVRVVPAEPHPMESTRPMPGSTYLGQVAGESTGEISAPGTAPSRSRLGTRRARDLPIDSRYRVPI
jgi:hypothetical protein